MHPIPVFLSLVEGKGEEAVLAVPRPIGRFGTNLVPEAGGGVGGWVQGGGGRDVVDGEGERGAGEGDVDVVLGGSRREGEDDGEGVGSLVPGIWGWARWRIGGIRGVVEVLSRSWDGGELVGLRLVVSCRWSFERFIDRAASQEDEGRERKKKRRKSPSC